MSNRQYPYSDRLYSGITATYKDIHAFCGFNQAAIKQQQKACLLRISEKERIRRERKRQEEKRRRRKNISCVGKM